MIFFAKILLFSMLAVVTYICSSVHLISHDISLFSKIFLRNSHKVLFCLSLGYFTSASQLMSGVTADLISKAY